MRDVKEELALGGDANWPEVSYLKVEGDPDARPWSLEGEEETIRSWSTVAVLEVAPEVPCLVGFITPDVIKFLSAPVITLQGRFGMRVGREDTIYYVFPVDHSTPLSLELVELTREDDPAYPDLPLY